MSTINIISLGWGCAIRTELIRRYFPEQPTLFFDYLGNFDGLDTCTQIILNDFKDFRHVNDLCLHLHPRWNTLIELKPISLCFNPPGIRQEILVSTRYKNLVFYHYEHSTDTLKSFVRKGGRLKSLLQETQTPTFFLYYRQYDEPLNDCYAEDKGYSITAKLAMLEAESLRFRDAIEQKYPALPFTLIAMIAEPLSFQQQVTPIIDDFLRDKANNQARKIIFDRVLAASPEDTRKLSSKSWGRIFRTRLLPNPLDRLRKTSQNFPYKIKRLASSIVTKQAQKKPRHL